MALGGLHCDKEEAPTAAPASRNNLSTMQTTALTIHGHKVTAWVARTDQEREKGLMNVTAADLAPLPDGSERGMLFVFEQEQILQFWMLNTLVPLDIAFLCADGQIVGTHTMGPHETRLYSSSAPARMALEVRAGLLAQWGVASGDSVQIPESFLTPSRP